MQTLEFIGMEIKVPGNGCRDILFAVSGSDIYDITFQRQPRGITEACMKKITKYIKLPTLEVSQSKL